MKQNAVQADSGIQVYKKAILSLCILLFCSSTFANSFDELFLEAIRLKHKGEHHEAYLSLKAALALEPTSSAALYLISSYYLSLKQEEQALWSLQKAVDYAPDNLEYKRALAELSSGLGRYEEAIELFETLAKENPQNPMWQYHLCNLYLQQNQTDKAIRSFDILENNVGVNEALSLQKYQLYLSLNKNKEALKELENLAGKFPHEAKYQILLGDFYLDRQKNDKALSYYDKAAHLDPNDPYYFIAMSNYYEAIGDSAAAIGEIEKALKNPALDVESQLGILGRYINDIDDDPKDLETANRLFEILMANQSQNRELNQMYGQFLVLQGKMEEAKFQFQLVTEAMPEDLSSWINLLQIVLKEENTDEIISICESAIIYFPDIAEIYLYLGTAYFLKENHEKALSAYLNGLDAVPSENRRFLSIFAGQIADIYYQQGQKDQSFEYYKKSLSYESRNAGVLNNYAYHLAVEKQDLDDAERMAAVAIQIEPNNPTYLDTYAWVFYQKGNYSLAKFYIENALMKSQEPNADLFEHYGDILYKIGNIPKAVENWEKARLLLDEAGENSASLERKISEVLPISH